LSSSLFRRWRCMQSVILTDAVKTLPTLTNSDIYEATTMKQKLVQLQDLGLVSCSALVFLLCANQSAHFRDFLKPSQNTFFDVSFQKKKLNGLFLFLVLFKNERKQHRTTFVGFF
jgi:hypothetical protein